MARDTGLLNLSANFEVQNAAPLDARVRVPLLTDLTNAGTFGVYAYAGMAVSVYSDPTPENNGIWFLKTLPYTTFANWEQAGSGGAGGALGTLAFYNQNGSQDNLPVSAFADVTQLSISDYVIFGQDAKLYVNSAGNYGWNDIIATLNVKGSGANNPTFGTFRDGIQGWLFSHNTMNQVWIEFHILHDYALNTPLYPHIHWAPTTANAGTVRWGIEYTVAKGHNQEAFPATTTFYVETAVTNQQYRHIITEASDLQAISGANVEPDTVILMRIFRDAAHPNDTYPDDIFSWQCDLHYKQGRHNTLNKAPNFYG